MDFARKQLEKYGWSDGKGLGKNEDGIAAPLKPKLKFDSSGVGHDVGEQFTNNWWEKLFNSASENIDVRVDNNEVRLNVIDEDLVEISTKNYSLNKLKKNKNLQYGSFLKTAKLTEGGVENYDVAPINKTEPINGFQALTDDELFAACGGRTAHKGARHGLKLSGKLSRIEKQEKLLLKKMKKVSLSDEMTEKKLKKIKKQKEEAAKNNEFNISDGASTSSSPSIKKKNKKRKSVSFNETVTTRYVVELDTSFDSEIGSLRDENSNEPTSLDAGSDEGIEHDLENNNNKQEDNHRSFEEGQFNYNDLSKAERKKLKKKRKLEAKLNSSTQLFLQELDEEDMNVEDETEKDLTTKKRKYDEACTSVTDFPNRGKAKKNKLKRKKQKKFEEKQINSQLNSIARSLDNVCRISDDE